MKRPTVCLTACVLLTTALAARPAAAVGPGDPGYDHQWNMPKIGAEEAWGRGAGQGVTIAVVDTGVDLAHEDLSGKIVADVSCIGADDDPARCDGPGQDDHGHGTHVAGIAAAATGNGRGVAGVAPEAGIMAVRVLAAETVGGERTGSASGTLGDVRAGIRWAVDHGADVVNLSLSENVLFRNLLGSDLEPIIEDAWSKGVIVVVAAGNETGLFPSGYGSVDAFVVTATDKDDVQASYASNVGGAKWGIAAPGGDGPGPEGLIFSTWWDPDTPDVYTWSSGTSMAAPHVAGAAAVLRSLGLSPQETVDRLLGTAVDLGAKGADDRYGHGRLDLSAATAGLSRPGAAFEPPPPTAPPAPVVTAAAVPAPEPSVVQGRTMRRSGPPTAAPPAPTTTVPAFPEEPATPVDLAAPADPDEPAGGGPALWIFFGVVAASIGLGVLRSAWLRRRQE